MAEDSDDKTEEPTHKKLDKAREEGSVPQTAETKILASLLAGLVIVGMMAPGLAKDIQRLLVPFIERPHEMHLDINALVGLCADLAMGLGMAMAMPFLLVVVLAIGLSVAQTKGFMWVPKKLAPDFNKLNPFTGIKRMVSPIQLMELGKALLKVTVVGALLFYLMYKQLPTIINLSEVDLPQLMEYIQDQVYWLIFVTVLMVATLTAGDYLFQHWRFTEKMKMTKQEVKDEHKQQEGDPQVKGRIRSLRMQRARKRMMAAVPKADVIVTNPTHYAVALKYDVDTMNAPILVAKGADLVAKRIRDLATDHDIPIVENPPLARALYASVELDQEIPQEHYKTVAEIIGYVMRLKGKLAN